MIDVAKRLISANVSRFTPTQVFAADKRVPRNKRFCYQYRRFNSRYHTTDLQSRTPELLYKNIP